MTIVGLIMKAKIPVNPRNLKWARESANLLLEDVASRMKKDPDTIQEWEDGVSTPTYIQLETLAYNVYKRPIAVFFFPEPPQEISPEKSFRTLPESEVAQLSPRFLQLFRQAQAMQANLDELNSGTNPAPRKIFREVRFNPTDRLATLTRKIREYLGIDLATQVGWKDRRMALREWRRAVEASGIFVFKEAFKLEEISGFCLYDGEFPVIYINNSMPETRQIFTLFHELTHLLLGTSGIDTENDSFLRSIRGNNKKIEILCNRFAGEFLAPTTDFARLISGVDVDDALIEDLASRYKVSREVVLRKCLDRGLIDQSYYEDRRQVWIDEAKRRRRSSTRGNYYRTRAAYLGDTYLNLVFGKYYQKQFSTGQLAEYLGVKVDHIAGLEATFLGRGSFE